MRTIAAKLVATFLLIIVVLSTVFTAVGVRFIGSRIVAEAQEKVRNDLNAAREIYLSNLNHVYDVVRFSADRTFLRAGLSPANLRQAATELEKTKVRERLDVLTLLDARGRVVLRTSNPGVIGDDQSQDPLILAAMQKGQPVSGTVLVPAEQLRRESPALAERAHMVFIDTPMARARPETEETSGMMLKAVSPIFNDQKQLIGLIYGGILLNRNTDIVDKIKHTVFQEVKYQGQDIGTATIFQDDLRISTNVQNADGSRALGTRIAEDVYVRVVQQGQSWIGRAYVVNNWYITAYEPIRDPAGKIIGILYVGILEQKYVDMQRRAILLFVGLTLLAAFASMTLAYFISRRITDPIHQLVKASKQVARGNLDTKVEVASQDELRELADSFNSMAMALKARDQQLKEFTRKKIMESERLAIVGQLAANVAHELNNPLTGIVSFAQLLLERLPAGSPERDPLQKIATQANRCKGIVRGLLDFARPRKPQKRPASVNAVLEECISLVENQALFHNIQIVKRFSSTLPTCTMDPAAIQQVFINMIINAAEAMNGNGTLTLTTQYDETDHQIEVLISDTGHGIPPEDVERMFDPFFTTKEVGHGTGLGLAISYGIIKEHNGTISVESELNKGTTLTVRLPVMPVMEMAESAR